MIHEEAVEAAGRAIYELKFGPEGWDDLPDKPKGQYLDQGRHVLEAAAPLVAAAALEDAAAAFEDLPVSKGAEIRSGTWDWFELFPIDHMRDRADDIRGGK